MSRATNFSAINVGARRTNAGSDIQRILKGTFTLNPASIASGAQAEQTVTVSGLTTSDVVVINPPAAFEACFVSVPHVSAANTIKFVIGNSSGGAIDAASGTWSYIAFQ